MTASVQASSTRRWTPRAGGSCGRRQRTAVRGRRRSRSPSWPRSSAGAWPTSPSWAPPWRRSSAACAGAPATTARETVALTAGLSEPACAADGLVAAGAVAIDAAAATSALVLVAGPEGYAVGAVPIAGVATGADLTRPVARLAPTATARSTGQSRLLDEDDGRRLAEPRPGRHVRRPRRRHAGCARRWRATTPGRAASTGPPIGSFQAVQHLLADAFVALEGSRSIALHAAWAVDALPSADALAAASAAKAYCARAARDGVRDGHSGARWHRQHLGVPRPRLPAAGAALDRRARRCRAQPGPGARGPRHRRATMDFADSAEERAFRLRLRALARPATIRACRRRRRPTSTGPGRPPGTRRSTTPASSACRGRPRSAATACPASTR